MKHLIFVSDFITHSLFADGWAKSDLVYVWQDGNPVQLAGNLSLPGGFQLGAFGSEYCDVVTATGRLFLIYFFVHLFFFIFFFYFMIRGSW